ncbi:MAG: hypothetical protein COW00_14730 [Bdellovibrio sp. CG12_big_fil_rev_8_21_14_0_65_39_13]|nr:MAG: hypothetical protein COW78_14020 [Bdellovibrio sp. CG22_combo_CG10-13_8_21_14_all_39_27]PIQ58550.1 MAG: hypothetical protein COW00_14730 [Bdellovibrio sp. CG12_big_fil_rev_8_21_14_0_65_39_13]PIR32467.1 MAG: hypothetical protein COV37_19875 [Bdellovibrio sp. CG11_big_fil_rev_8_21_14_0_20_39_38]PJB53231.1 MAG: hypothetical protein CO099_08240 [Bdellovibrio sp. CG_4_9_14_3_um_filter_39_7]
MKLLILIIGLLSLNIHAFEVDRQVHIVSQKLPEILKSIDSSDFDDTTLRTIESYSLTLLTSINKLKSQTSYQERPLSGAELLELHTLMNCFTKLTSTISMRIDEFAANQDYSFHFVQANVVLGILSYRLVNELVGSQKIVNVLSYSDRSFDLKKRELFALLKVLSSRSFKEKTLKKMQGLSSSEIELVKSTQYFSQAFDFQKDSYNELRSLIFKNKIFKAKRFALHHLSGAFGNTSGSIRWRKGYLFKNESIIRKIESELKPLDIITEKTAFALTDKFIPGHFGHNAIWLGTKDQLIEIGIWNHPVISPFQNEIEQGFSIIETDRTGTHLKKLSDFMNVDEFAALRISHLGDDLSHYYKIALSQLGKKYDFNFDVESTDRLVCSELLYQTFAHIIWPTEKYLGRFTISPDNVVSLSLFNQSPLSLVNYIAGDKQGEIHYKGIKELAEDIDFNEDHNYLNPQRQIDYVTLLNIDHGNHFYKLSWFK